MRLCKRRVLFISNLYYPQVSGVPIVVRYLAEGLSKENEVCVYACLFNGSERKKIINEVQVQRYAISHNIWKGVSESKETKSFIADINSGKFDLIIIESIENPLALLAMKHITELKGKKILHMHGYSNRNRPFLNYEFGVHNIRNAVSYLMWWKYYYVAGRYIRFMDCCLSLSHINNGEEYLKQNKAKQIEILGNAADDIFFDESNINENALSKYIDYAADKEYAISLGNFREEKNQLGLVKEFLKCRQNIDLILIGKKTSRYYDRVVEYIEKNRDKTTNRIIVLENVDRADLPSVLRNATIYVAASLWEGYSISIIEAMATGLPFISTNVGNAMELPGGIVVNSMSEMHTYIDKLVRDKRKRMELSKNGREYAAEHCTIAHAVNALSCIASQLVGE